jgi:hypothetical protein
MKEHDKLRNDIRKLDMDTEEALRCQVKELEAQLVEAREHHRKYVERMQLQLIPKLHGELRALKVANEALEDVRLQKAALINFIFEQGKGNQYFETFVNEFYPYDVLDFDDRNELHFSEFQFTEEGSKILTSRMARQISQIIAQN